ncbi:NFACT family protein [Candidatus Woesearchaeota archaeon]|nr:NFACT family protein [Candidatus Woesearchaeota archaeon]
MKNQISSLELNYLTRELKTLVNSKLNKVYSKKNSFVFDFHKTSKGRLMLKVELPGKIYLTKYKEEYEEPGNFCMFLRKHLANSFVRDIYTKDFERILIIEFKTKEKKLKLIFELFSKGNIVLVDDKGIIKNIYRKEEWKDRILKPKEKYKFPPSGINIINMDMNEFRIKIMKSNKDLVRTLAVKFSLGGLYSEEVCVRTKTKKGINTSILKKNELLKLYKTIKSMLNSKEDPTAYFEDGKLKEITPFELRMFQNLEKKKYSSFNESLDESLSIMAEEKNEEEIIKTKKGKVEKLKEIIEKQKEDINKRLNIIDENSKKGEILYKNYNMLKQLLDDFRKIQKEHSWEEIKEKLKNHKIIKEINEKEGYIIVDVK